MDACVRIDDDADDEIDSGVTYLEGVEGFWEFLYGRVFWGRM